MERKDALTSLGTELFYFIFSLDGVLHGLTLRSGMENFQQEAKWCLVMVRFSFSTLVKLVLSSGTEINQKSAMTLNASRTDLLLEIAPKTKANR